VAVPITNFNLAASRVQADLTVGKPLPPTPGAAPPPVNGDTFVPGAVPVWQPPAGFTPINFIPPAFNPIPFNPPLTGDLTPGGIPGPEGPGGWPLPSPPVAEGGYGGFVPFQPMATPTYGNNFYQQPTKLGITYGDLSKPGSLVVVDQFQAPMPSFGIGGFAGPIKMAHGHLVSESAKGDGFDGNLIPSEHMGKYPQQRGEINQALAEPNISREEFLERLEKSVALQGVGLLDAMSERLEGLNEAGLHHSAVNLSYGLSQAHVVEDRYKEAALAWSGWEPLPDFKKPLLDNYARAFDLDAEKLRSQVPEIHGPERAKFQQALADQVASIMENNEPLRDSKAHFATAVRELEANHNSVVVSACNGGRVLAQMSEHAHTDKPIRVSKHFQDNIMATPETTVVGATSGTGKDEKVAVYSSNYEGVHLYANGDAPMPASNIDTENAQGTSFASPKVAQAMAKLHQLFPDKSSAEIETMLKEQLSHQLLSYDGNVERPVLNDHADFGMLSRYT
jgi:hypothetical protein